MKAPHLVIVLTILAFIMVLFAWGNFAGANDEEVIIKITAKKFEYSPNTGELPGNIIPNVAGIISVIVITLLFCFHRTIAIEQIYHLCHFPVLPDRLCVLEASKMPRSLWLNPIGSNAVIDVLGSVK
ncbi:MAG: hypothetical protein M0Q01_03345 [Syntrophales bacterium]|jgi:hypothetical protein|nr:hypothetical protein [Syntrophales bacterium]